jgi:transcriptional regulator with XRE-family HTH domain
MSKIGPNLKIARTKAGLTQKEVESLLGLRELSIKDYETGRLKLPIEMAVKLAKLYKVDLNALTSLAQEINHIQNKELGFLGQLLHRGEVGFLFLDPVIRAKLEEESVKIFDHSVFDLLSLTLTEKQKKSLASEILKTLGSLIGVDQKITESELSFFNKLINDLGLGEQVKSISRSMTRKHLPDLKYFDHSPALKHFMIWLMFFLAKSSGKINHVELLFIDECAEALKINLSNYLKIKSYFQGGSKWSSG